MILQSLVNRYEVLNQQGKIVKPGWCKARVSYALNLNLNGELTGVLPLKREEEREKKTVYVPQILEVPEMIVRTSGVAANFLCDNAGYLLGMDPKKSAKKAKECFEKARELHSEILQNGTGSMAMAVKSFFENWNPDKENCIDSLEQDMKDDVLLNANLVFQMNGVYAHDDEEVRQLWKNYRKQSASDQMGMCLVTGMGHQTIARVHSTIKGVRGAQSSGAMLVSFNAPSFNSYGKEFSNNAPISEYAAFAYTTVLNDMLSDRSYHNLIGDTTVVFWAEKEDDEYQDFFSGMMDPKQDDQEILKGFFENVALGLGVNDEKLSLDTPFNILGLAPNAARLSVRFYYRDTFGNIALHVKQHYDRLEIVRSSTDQIIYLPLWKLLSETINKKSKDKKVSPVMAGAVYRSIITGEDYPRSLLNEVMIRIRAEQGDYKINRGRAAIIKAYLLKNTRMKKEELTVALNEDSQVLPYVLGRLFAVLEGIQQDANSGINATIKDRYFNSACATPAAIFPVLLKLKNSHIRKLDKGKRVYYEKLIGLLQDKIEMNQKPIPVRMSLEEQGIFILGYYHQTQKRYEKKNKEENENGGSDQKQI